MSAVRYCVTMTQHHSYIEFAAQGTHRRAKLVCQISDSLRHCTCILNSHLSFPLSLATMGESRMDLSNLFFHLCWGEGEQQNAFCSTFSVLQWACWPWPGALSEGQWQKNTKVSWVSMWLKNHISLTPALHWYAVWSGHLTDGPTIPWLISQKDTCD